MLSRLFRLTALAVAIAAPAALADEPKKSESAPAKDAPVAKSSGPAVIVRVQSIENLLKTADYLRTLAPEDAGEQIKQGLEFIKSIIDDKKGLEGIDVKGPIGLYVTFTEELGPTPPVVVLVPIADEEAVLAALKDRLNLTVTKEKDGSYKTEPEQSPFPIYFRFANKYAYITISDSANIDPKTLPKPADVLGGGKAEHLISAAVRIDRLPDALKKMAIAAVENQLAMAKDKPIPNETKAIKEFKDKAIDELTLNLKNILEGGEEAALRLNVDPKSEEVAIELELKGTKGSKLAKDIQSVRDNKSVVGGALSFPDTALSFNLSASLAANLKKLLPPVVDDAIAEIKKQGNIPDDILAKAEPLIKALLPTVKAGDLDLGVAMVGPDKDDKFTLVGGLKVVDGKKIEEAVKEIVKKDLPPEISALFVLDAEKLSGGTMMHTVKLSDFIDEKGQKVVGKSDLHFVFRDDLVLVAIGPKAKDVLTKALASKPADIGVVQLSVSLSRIVALAGDNAEQLEAAKKAAEKIFGKGGSKADQIRFSVEGGDSLKIKLMAKGKAIQFIVEMLAPKPGN
jgi:hypothetical protein